MITNYKIKNISETEEVLVLYITMSEEFSLEWFSKLKNTTFKEFIGKHHIFWNGTKVFLVVGGITLAVLNYPNTIEKEDSTLSYLPENIISIQEIDKNYNQELPEEEIIIETETNEETKEEITNDENVQNTNTDSSSTKPNTTIKPNTNTNTSSNVNNTKPSANTNTNSSNNNSSVEQNKPPTVESQPEKEEKPAVTYVTVYRNNGSVITLSMEDYLIGVTAAEMPASFSKEALKAQSVLARTYAMKAISTGKKLTDTVSTQRYIDTNEMKTMWGSSYDSYYQKIKSAVLETENMVVTYNNNLIEAVYHSTSNGRTEDSEYVWGNTFSYLKSVDSPWDKSATTYFRSIEIPKTEFLNKFQISEEEYNVEIISRNRSGRVEKIKVGSKTYTGVEFRTKLALRSADFDIYLTDTSIKIDTRGYGHGVGMSQYGANGMAKEGKTFRQILNHYYTGIQIESMPFVF